MDVERMEGGVPLSGVLGDRESRLKEVSGGGKGRW